MPVAIGCTGWSYDGWSGIFYPKSLSKSKWLEYYSKIFEITEINSTFYKVPDQSTTKRWNEQTPDGFRFTAKFPSIITHEKRLENIQSNIFSFLASLTPIHHKISALLLQLPPSLSFLEAKPRLKSVLSAIPDNIHCPIEARHDSWFTEEAIGFLKDNRLCLVWNDVSGVNNPLPATSDYLYIRLIGDRSIPDSEFGKIVKNKKESVKRWAKKIKQTVVSDVFLFANNHYEGFGPATANSLRLELGLSELIWEEKKQQRLS